MLEAVSESQEVKCYSLSEVEPENFQRELGRVKSSRPWPISQGLSCVWQVPTILVATVSSIIQHWMGNEGEWKEGDYVRQIVQASLIAQLEKNLPAMEDTPVQFQGWEICWRRGGLPTPVFLGFSCGLAGKESACNGGDLGSVPGLVRSPGERKGYPLQYSGLENSMDNM